MPNLDEIRERWAKGTPGPWEATVIDGWGECVINPNDPFQIIAVVKRPYAWECSSCTVEEFSEIQKEHNATTIKIANAPTDIAFLLAEVERLEYNMGDLGAWKCPSCGYFSPCGYICRNCGLDPSPDIED